MTPTDRAALKSLGLTAGEFALITRTDHRTVSGWSKPYGSPTPGWVPLLLDAWTRCPDSLSRARALRIAQDAFRVPT